MSARTGAAPVKRKKGKRWLHLSRTQRRRLFWAVTAVIVMLVTVCVVYIVDIYRASQTWNKETMFVTEPEVIDPIQYITVNGKQYYYNENILAILLLGIDDWKIDGFNGQCDVIAVLVLDTEQNTMRILSIPRDTMGDIVRKDANGNFYDETNGQLALAHSYGRDDLDSLELSRRSISNFLYGVPIQKAISIEIAGVPKANDLVGGVTVQCLQDFSGKKDINGRYNTSMKEGETVHLDGAQAMLYIRARDTSVETSSMERLQRQIQYIKAYFSQAKQRFKENPTFPLTMYSELSQYLTLDLSVQEIAYLGSKVLGLELTDDTIVTLDGTLTKGEKFMEFYVDEDLLLQTVLELFYIQKSEVSSERVNTNSIK